MLSEIKSSYHLQRSVDIIKKTILEKNNRLSNEFNCNVYFKREDLQPVRSFKIRGAFNKIIQLSDVDKNRGIVTASAGNHAQGVAYTCQKLGINCNIFVPNKTPLQKINRIKNFGKEYCNLNIIGNTFDDCLNKSKEFTNENNSVFVHPFDDLSVIQGQGVIAQEICEEIKPDIILGSIGGGGLLSGIISYIKPQYPECKIYGVEPEGASSMYYSIKKNKIITLDEIDTFVDGASVKTVGKETFNICKNNISEIIRINNYELSYEMLNLYQDDGIITEPAGALSVCGLKHLNKYELKNKNVICIISGGNNDVSRYNEIIENSLQYHNLKHYFLIEFTQTPGQLKNFLLNILGKNDDITLFEYIKKTNKEKGTVLIGIQLSDQLNLKTIENNMIKYGYIFTKIDKNNLLYSYLL